MLMLAAACFGSIESSHGVTLSFDYSYDIGFFSEGTDARDRLEDAGSFFSSLLIDDLDAIEPDNAWDPDLDTGAQTPNAWKATFTNPSTGAAAEEYFLSVPADTMVIYVGARDLGGSTLGSAGPGGYSVFGTSTFLSAVTTRGEGITRDDEGAGEVAVDFGPWGGALSMDSDSTWDFSLDGSTLGAGENHFYSVLLHELGHVLGIGGADSWDNKINEFDEFTGANAMAEYGGPVPVTADGGHWIDDTDPDASGDQVIESMVYGEDSLQEVAMDPNLTTGTAKFFTDLDVAGLEDIGWEVALLPEPSSSFLLLMGLGTMLLHRRRP